MDTREELDNLIKRMREPKRVLLVDDNSVFMDTVALLCEQMRMEVVKADTPEEAILAYESADFDLAIVDLVFPRHLTGLDGIDIVKHIRSKHPVSPPVILLTGYPHHERLKAVTDIPGPVTIVPKPFANFDLSELLTRMIHA